jgi:hypothetical protein
MGAMGTIIDPRSRGQSRLVRELGAEAMPPLWQYLFSPAKENCLGPGLARRALAATRHV